MTEGIGILSRMLYHTKITRELYSRVRCCLHAEYPVTFHIIGPNEYQILMAKTMLGTNKSLVVEERFLYVKRHYSAKDFDNNIL